MKFVVKKSRKQRGSVYVEAIAVLPLLAFLAFAAYDMGRYFFSYMTISHTARELSVMGGRIYNMSGSATNLNVSSAEYQACLEEKTKVVGSTCGHKIMHWAAQRLIYSQPKFTIPADTVVSTTFDGASKVLTIEIRASFSPYFTIFNGLKLRVVEKMYNENG
jgi:hypothetical protein